MLNIVVCAYGDRPFVGRKMAKVVGEYHLLARLVLGGVFILLHVK